LASVNFNANPGGLSLRQMANNQEAERRRQQLQQQIRAKSRPASNQGFGLNNAYGNPAQSGFVPRNRSTPSAPAPARRGLPANYKATEAAAFRNPSINRSGPGGTNPWDPLSAVRGGLNAAGKAVGGWAQSQGILPGAPARAAGSPPPARAAAVPAVAAAVTATAASRMAPQPRGGAPHESSGQSSRGFVGTPGEAYAPPAQSPGTGSPAYRPPVRSAVPAPAMATPRAPGTADTKPAMAGGSQLNQEPGVPGTSAPSPWDATANLRFTPDNAPNVFTPGGPISSGSMWPQSTNAPSAYANTDAAAPTTAAGPMPQGTTDLPVAAQVGSAGGEDREMARRAAFLGAGSSWEGMKAVRQQLGAQAGLSPEENLNKYSVNDLEQMVEGADSKRRMSEAFSNPQSQSFDESMKMAPLTTPAEIPANPELGQVAFSPTQEAPVAFKAETDSGRPLSEVFQQPPSGAWQQGSTMQPIRAALDDQMQALSRQYGREAFKEGRHLQPIDTTAQPLLINGGGDGRNRQAILAAYGAQGESVPVTATEGLAAASGIYGDVIGGRKNDVGGKVADLGHLDPRKLPPLKPALGPSAAGSPGANYAQWFQQPVASSWGMGL
jgi:hypothetical protein